VSFTYGRRTKKVEVSFLIVVEKSMRYFADILFKQRTNMFGHSICGPPNIISKGVTGCCVLSISTGAPDRKKFNRGKPLKHARPWIKLFRRKGGNIMPQRQNGPIKNYKLETFRN
jgi:hypothetical protein